MESKKTGKYPAFISRSKNKRVKVVVVDSEYEVVFNTVDGDSRPRSINIPLKNVGNTLAFRLSKEGALNLSEKLSEALSYSFTKYFNELRKRRDDDKYNYTDEDLVKYIDYIKGCWASSLSVYKCLEFMYCDNNEK